MKVTYKCHQTPQMKRSFGDKLRQKRGSFSDKAHKNRGSFSEIHRKNRGFQGQNFLNILSNLSKFSKNPIFLPKIVTCLTIECENEGSLQSDKVVSGSFGDKEFVENRGSLVKMGVFR